MNIVFDTLILLSLLASAIIAVLLSNRRKNKWTGSLYCKSDSFNDRHYNSL